MRVNRTASAMSLRTIGVIALLACVFMAGVRTGRHTSLDSSPKREPEANRVHAPIQFVPADKDGWDIAAILIPVVVTLGIAYVGYRAEILLRRSKAIDSLAAYVPLLSSNDKRQAELAKSILEEMLHNRSQSSDLDPCVILRAVHKTYLSEYSVDTSVLGDGRYRWHGWIVKFLVPVYLYESEIWVTGLLHGQWFVFPCARPLPGVVVINGRSHSFEADECTLMPGHSMGCVRLHTSHPEVRILEGDVSAPDIVGHSRNDDRITLVVKSVEGLTGRSDTIEATTPYDSSLAGFVAMRAIGNEVAGIVSGASQTNTVTIVRMQAIQEFLRRAKKRHRARRQ